MADETDAERVLKKLSPEQKGNFANLLEARRQGGREALRAALKAMYPNLPDGHPSNDEDAES